ncbi:MAG: alpha/beta fold hydrolase [Hyphomonas sp.]
MKPAAAFTSLAAAMIAGCTPPLPVKEEVAAQAPDARAIIADIGRIDTPNGIEESFAANIGGVDQWLSIRGKDRSNPVILLVHGGPGSAELAIGWTFQRGWEDYFTVIQWDQRVAGKSYGLNDPETVIPTLSVERMTDDVIEVMELARERLGQEKVILIGHSWGSVIGLNAVLERPDLVAAYVPHGQVVNMRRNEEEGFRFAMDAALSEGNAEAVAELEALQPYPGELTVERIGAQRTWAIHYGALAAYRDSASPWFGAMRLSPEYSDADANAWNEGSLASITALIGELSAVDFDGVTEVEVPVFMLHGRHDYTTPAQIGSDWLARLKAPAKGEYWFEHSAHLAFMEEPGRVLTTLVTCIRPYATEPTLEAARAKAEAGCVHGG